MSIPVDKMVRVYLKIRARRSQLAKEDEDLKAQQSKIETALVDACNDNGTNGFKTDFGTVSRRTQTRYWAADWSAFHEFVKEHDAFDLLEKRLAQRNMEDFLKENPDLKPPSLQSESKYVISVTKPRTRT